MPRPLRYMPRPYNLFEISIRTIQERFLLKPSAELNDLILGVIGRALSLHPTIQLFLFKVISNHFHIILAAPDQTTLAEFMNHVDSNIAREAGRLYGWRDKFWSSRYHALSIEDDTELVKRVKYVLAQGCKEGLVASPLDWPGVSCERALLHGETLHGTWFDRSSYSKAERRDKKVRLQDFATRYEVPLTTLPILEGKTKEQQRAFYQNLVDEIEEETRQACIDEGKALLGVEGVLRQDPHLWPRNSKHSPAPLCLASTKQGRQRFREAYRQFVSQYRQAVERLRRGDTDVKFPLGCYLPPVACPPHMVEAAAPG